VDRPGFAWRSSGVTDGLSFDLSRGTITHDCGYVIPIVDMFDRYGDYTDVPAEVVVIGMIMPPDGLYVTLDLRDVPSGEIVISGLQ
jgi:hypothetical protein